MLAHLRALARHGSDLNRREGAAAMRAATTLAVALFAGVGRKSPEEREELEDAFSEAARHYIELNYWRHDLTADRIATAIGCSRAHLYRMFANRG
jgi:AraC family transcriptional activator of tynA and feaB